MNILAIGAHPDDVETMCAGTLAKYASLGHKVFIATATNGGGTCCKTGKSHSNTYCGTAYREGQEYTHKHRYYHTADNWMIINAYIYE